MYLYLLELIGKLLTLLVVTFISFFHPTTYKQEESVVINTTQEKYGTLESKVELFETKVVYNKSLPNEMKKIITRGENGIIKVNEDGSETLIQKAVSEVIEIGTGGSANYYGKLSGYGPDCPGCSATGNVSCYTEKRTKHSLIYNGDKYIDDEYGEIRIIAAAKQKFPCGTIVEIEKSGSKPVVAVVLDSGASMSKAWNNNGTVWFDLAYTSQANARNGNFSGNNLKFTVKRWGW